VFFLGGGVGRYWVVFGDGGLFMNEGYEREGGWLFEGGCVCVVVYFEFSGPAGVPDWN